MRRLIIGTWSSRNRVQGVDAAYEVPAGSACGVISGDFSGELLCRLFPTLASRALPGSPLDRGQHVASIDLPGLPIPSDRQTRTHAPLQPRQPLPEMFVLGDARGQRSSRDDVTAPSLLKDLQEEPVYLRAQTPGIVRVGCPLRIGGVKDQSR